MIDPMRERNSDNCCDIQFVLDPVQMLRVSNVMLGLCAFRDRHLTIMQPERKYPARPIPLLAKKKHVAI